MRYIRLIVILIFTANAAAAQQPDNDYTINLSTYNSGEHVLLRWFPETIEDFKHGIQKGFVVERREVNTTNTQWIEIVILKPAPFERFIELTEIYDETDLMMMVIYQDSLVKMMEESTEITQAQRDSFYAMKYSDPETQNFMYKFALIACEFNVNLAAASALYHKDESVQANRTYEYRVVFGDRKKQDRCKIVEVKMPEKTFLPVAGDFAARFDDEAVTLSWGLPALRQSYSGYNIERSKDGTKFEKINSEPVIPISTEEEFRDKCLYRDSLPDLEQEYYYRIYGLTHFGINGPYSPVMKGHGKKHYNVRVWIDTVFINDKNEAEIRWSLPGGNKSDVKGFAVQRAKTLIKDSTATEPLFNVVSEKILPAKTRDFIDKKTLTTNYYRVLAFGHKPGYIAISNTYFVHQIDSVPPSPPAGLRGVIDSLGVVTLEWNPNPEPDVMAYRVFFGNNLRDPFMSCSDTFLLSPLYLDTIPLNNLNNAIYYKVTAIDKNYNQSAMSEPIKLMKPDTMPPAKAVFQSITQPADKMVLVWENSPSVDVKTVELYRQIDDTGKVVLLKVWDIKTLEDTYTDPYEFNGEEAHYFLYTYDEVGNYSVEAGFPRRSKGTRPGCITDLKVTPDYRAEGIRLRWKKGNCKLEKYYIYRQENGGEMRLLDTINGAEQTFVDKRIVSGSSYIYSIRAIAERPSKLLTSEPVSY